jgi:flagellar protein FliO/FliZ
LRVVASLPLGSKERLVVVEVGEEQLLFSISAKGVELIKPLEQRLLAEQHATSDMAQPLKQLFKKIK